MTSKLKAALCAAPASPYPTRADHVAALERTKHQGEHHDMLVANLVPPLPKTPDELAALAAVAPPSDTPPWLSVECAYADARTPWRLQDRDVGWARWVTDTGVLIISGIGPLKGYRVRLLTSTEPVVERQLVYSGSGKIVSFDRQAVFRQMDLIIKKRAALPSKWAWSPSPP